jgi:hypothetical protein
MSTASCAGNEGSISYRGQPIGLLTWTAEISAFGWRLTCTFEDTPGSQPRIGGLYVVDLITPDGHRFTGKAKLLKGNATRVGQAWLAMLIGVGALTEAPASR